MCLLSNPPENVGAVFDTAPESSRAGMMYLRERILEVANDMGITVEEALRWGQPAYLAPKGSTLRLGVPKTGGFAIYAHCGSSLIGDFASVAPDAKIEGRRAVCFNDLDEAKAQPLELLIAAALTYHLR